MVSNFVRRPLVSGAVLSLSLTVVVGCDEAVETPFFEEHVATRGGASGANQGGASGLGTGGSTAGSGFGGDAGTGGSATGGTTTTGDAGMSGTAGSFDLGGTGSGGTAGEGVSGTTTGGTGGSSIDCTRVDPNAVSFEDHCYVLRETPRTWAAAREDCASDGAHLVTIGSDDRTEAEFLAENDFVWTLGGMTAVWIGATDGRPSNQAGDFTPYAWITGESILFDRWSPGQPDNGQTACMENAPCSCGNTCWEHCAFMRDPDNDEPATWNDRHCEHVIGYVCEWDEPPP